MTLLVLSTGVVAPYLFGIADTLWVASFFGFSSIGTDSMGIIISASAYAVE